jgi:capsular exopolysaccharide synthesis family protein
LPRPVGLGPMAPAGVGGALAHAHAQAAPAGMSGGDVWRVLRANIWLIIGAFILSIGIGVVAYMYLSWYHPRFTAVGYVQVQPPNAFNPLGVSMKESVYDNTTVQIEQRTHAQVLKDYSLHTRVLQDPNAIIRNTGWFKQYLTKQRQPDGTVRELLNDADAKEDLQDHFDAIPIADSRLIKVLMSYKDPKDCRLIVENIVNVYLEDQRKILRDRTMERTGTLNLLKVKYENQLRQTRNDSNAKQARINQSGGQLTAYGGSPKDFELTKFVEQQVRLQATYNEIKAQQETTAQAIQQGIRPPAVESMVDRDTGVQRIKGQLDELELAKAGARARGGANHWQVEQYNAQIQRTLEMLDEKKAEVGAQMQVSLIEQLEQAAKSTEKDLDAVNKQIDNLKEELAEIATIRAEYLTLKDEEEAYRDLLDTVTQQLDTIQSQNQTVTANGLEWIRRPEQPDKKSFPNLPIVMSIAVGLGLALSLGIAFLREMLDTSVRSPRDIARVGQMNLLGMIPHDEDDPQSAGTPLPMVIFQAPHSIMAEQFRQVRTRLQHAASLDTTRSILVTSPSPGDGKSTVAVNLAAGLALNGRRILLVDANFRRPELHNLFGQPNDSGLANVLQDVANFEGAVRPTQVPNLDVLTSGQRPANPTELLESQALIDFIERALEEYDHVIFDSGPMLLVSETVALAPRVDGVVTVVRARSNSRGLLQRMRDGLRQVKAEHLGVVLNAVRSQGGGYYGRNIRTYYEYQNGNAMAAAR